MRRTQKPKALKAELEREALRKPVPTPSQDEKSRRRLEASRRDARKAKA